MKNPVQENEAELRETDALWHPCSLKFTSNLREEQYRRVTYPVFYVQDLLALVIELITGPIITYVMKNKLPWWNLCIWWGYSIVFAPLHIYAFFKYRSFFEKHRMRMVLLIRWIVMSGHVSFGFFMNVPQPKVASVFFAIITRSPLPNVIFTALSHRLEFRDHLIVQTVALLISLLWIPQFCSLCASNEPVMDTFTELGKRLNSVFSPSLILKTQDSAPYPCWLVSCMIIITTGFLLPTFFVFSAEVSSRAVFLGIRGSHALKEIIQDYSQSAYKLSMIVLSCSILGTWFILLHCR